MSKAQHTPGKMIDGRGFVYSLNANGTNRLYFSIQPGHNDFQEKISDNETIAASRRFVALWNACEGIATEALEAGLIQNLLRAMRDAESSAQFVAIAKAKGE